MTTMFIATGARRLEYALYVQRPERSLKATLPSLALTMPQKNSARVMRLAVAGAARQTQFTVTRKAGSGYYRHKTDPSVGVGTHRVHSYFRIDAPPSSSED